MTQHTVLRGFSSNPDSYVGQVGQLPGSESFSAGAMFRMREDFNLASAQTLLSSGDGATNGWLLRVAAGGVLTAVQIAAGPLVITATLDISSLMYLGKTIVAGLSVSAGNLELYVQGIQQDSAALGAAAVPSTIAPVVGGLTASEEATDYDIIGVGYHNTAFSAGSWNGIFTTSAQLGKLAGPFEIVGEPDPASSNTWNNLWNAEDLNFASPGVIERGGPDGVEADALPIPLPTWSDAHAPINFARSPSVGAATGLITLARQGFAAGSQRGLAVVKNPIYL